MEKVYLSAADILVLRTAFTAVTKSDSFMPQGTARSSAADRSS